MSWAVKSGRETHTRFDPETLILTSRLGGNKRSLQACYFHKSGGTVQQGCRVLSREFRDRHHMNLLPSLSQLNCGAHSRMQFDSTPALQGPGPVRTSHLGPCDQKYPFSHRPSRNSKRQSWDVVKWQIETHRNTNRRTKLRFFEAHHLATQVQAYAV
jgi:hypothetical protein